jgi:hypothetical protein
MKENNGIAKFEEKTGRKANLFDLSVIAVMPRDVYEEIKKRVGLALYLLEDGAPNTAADILKGLLGDKGKI